MDVAFLLENSQSIGSDAFKAMKTLVSSMLDNFHTASEPFISDHGDRIALKSYSPRDRKKGAAKTDFEFTTYGSQVLKKGHIQTSLQQLEGEATTGHALLWTTENLFPRISNLRKHKVIFVVSQLEKIMRERNS